MPNSAYRQIQIAEERGVLVVTLGDADIISDSVAEGLRRELLRVLAEYPHDRIILDFGRVGFITTIAFQPLLSIRRKAHDGRRQLVICGLTPEVAEVFEVTRLISSRPGLVAAFEHEETRTAAVARLANAATGR